VRGRGPRRRRPLRGLLVASLTLRFLGSGDAFGSGGRFQACLHLSGPGGTLLLDCGASSLIPLKRAGLDPGAVDAVVLSHLHGDHFGGLPFLVLDGQFSRRTRPLTVAGPPGARARVETAMETLFPGSSTVARRFAVEFRELPERVETAVGPARVTAYPVRHPSGAPAFALRLAWAGRTLAYSGDTAWTESLLEVARGADCFVCEAYVYDKQVPHHLDYATLRAHRADLGCRQLILTHMSADMLARRDDVGDADVEFAEDGLIVTL
jgi:ribonuclease BN (tRNA processing enzyme)